jgi:CheY-like chemotaxis protein
VRRVTRRILEEGGYRVLEAGDGAAALGCATSHDGPIDLLLAALELPRTSGPALAESIRGVRPGIGVLFVSGYVEDPAALGAGGGGRVAYLEKPFAPEALMARVRQVIESRPEA